MNFLTEIATKEPLGFFISIILLLVLCRAMFLMVKSTNISKQLPIKCNYYNADKEAEYLRQTCSPRCYDISMRNLILSREV